MKPLPTALISAVLGAALGAAIAFARSESPGDSNPLADALAGPAANLSRPKVVVEEAEYKFGSMQRGATRQHEFVVRNQGDAPLRLTAGSTSCKCTQFVVEPKPVPPGEEITVTLEWIARSAPGEFRQTANLNTNDPSRPMVALSVAGEVVEPSGLEPNSFVFGDIRSGGSASTWVLFYSNDVEDLQIEAEVPSGESVSERFEVKVDPIDKQDLPNANAVAGYKVTLMAKPGLPVGQVMEWVTLKTNQPDSEELEIPVFGRVVGDITLHGSGWSEEAGVLHLGMVPAEEGMKRRLILSSKGQHASDTKYELLSVDPPELKVELGETRRKNDDVYHTIITIEVPAGTRPMIHLNTHQGDDGLVRLKTTHPTSSELNLRVRFAVVQ